jgi:hypothetical protein
VLPTNVALKLSSSSNVQQLRGRDKAALIEARFQLQTFVSRSMPTDDTDAPRTLKGAKS